MEEHGKSFKVVLLGEGAVGKTSLMVRYTEDKSLPLPTSVQQRTREHCAGGLCHENFGVGRVHARRIGHLGHGGPGAFSRIGSDLLQGQPRHSFDLFCSIMKANLPLLGALLVFDISDKKSFDRVKNWVKELRSMLADKVTIFIIGNKCDLAQRRAVATEEAEEYARSIGAHFCECSAKTNEGVAEIFSNLASAMLSKISDELELVDGNSATAFQRHYGSRRSLRIADEEATQAERKRRGKCCR